MIVRDRIGIELVKMMTDPNPVVVFQHLFESNLYIPVFICFDSFLFQTLQHDFPILGPPKSSTWPTTWPRTYRFLAHLLKNDSNLGMMIKSEEDVICLWTMAAYAPIAGLRKTMLGQTVQEVISAIKAPTKISKLLENALKNFDSIHVIVDAITVQPEKPPPRSLVGMAIRSWGTAWSAQVTYVLLAEAVYAPQTTSASDFSVSIDKSLERLILEKYSAFADFVWNKNLRDAHIQRPLLDGNQIQSLFGLQKGGKFLKSTLDALLAWQFDHIDSGIVEAKAWLLDQRERLGIPLS